MPTPNKYHSDGSLYGQYWARGISTERYIVRGYVNTKRSFEWYGESLCKPLNLGIKKANRLAEALGRKFNKAQYLESLKG